jgi:protein O-GlcNAc transferase
MTIQEAMAKAFELERSEHFAEAESLILKILQCDPEYAGALALLAYVNLDTGRYAQGVELARKAIALNPQLAEAYCALGNSMLGLCELEEAIAAHEKAVALDPNYSKYLVHLGAVYFRACRTREAHDAFHRALELSPGDTATHSNVLITTVDLFPHEPERVFTAHRQWARVHADPLAGEIIPHTNDTDAERPLRIGYVTPPFSERAASFFLEPLLAEHDRTQFIITCYWTTRYPSSHPGYQRWRRYPHYGRDVKDLNDSQLAEMIRRDGIDILVDTAGHTIGNRLLVFARKPAPVQVTYVGYQDTTGLSTMDYRITDAYADPPGTTEQYYSEKIMRLPRTGYCYRPPDHSPEVSPLPAKKNGHITFGSTCRVTKMTPETFDSWCRVLKAVPESKMILRSDGLQLEMVQRRVAEQFKERGIGPERLEMLGWSTLRAYMETFQRIDLILDSFPFVGHTVTCHALWMGVPLVSRVGRTHTARMGLSVLSNLGLPELVTKDENEFVEVAAKLANDLPRLEQLRTTLRGRMQASPLMDAKAFSHDIAAAYRQMWREWCKAESPAAREGSHVGRGVVGVGHGFAVEADPRSMSWAGIPFSGRSG